MFGRFAGACVLRLLRLGRDREGVTAIEFALLAPIFIAFIFAIIDISLYFFSYTQLNAALQDAAREVRTGRLIGDGGASRTAFKGVICTSVERATPAFIRNCETSVQVDLRPFSSFSDADFANPDENGDGTISDTEAQFDTGEPSDVIIARAYYRYSTFFPGLSRLLAATTPDGQYITVTSAFRNEPFTGG